MSRGCYLFGAMKKVITTVGVLAMIWALATIGCGPVRDFFGLSFKNGTFIVHQVVETKDRFKGTGCDVDYTRERKMSCATGPKEKGEYAFVACVGDGYAFSTLMYRLDGTWRTTSGPTVKVGDDDRVQCITTIELLGPLPSKDE
jgi:hypothetical protein